MKQKMLIALLALMYVTTAEAVNVPNRFQFQGRILKTNGRDPIEEQNVTYKVQIRSADGACLLYEETHVRDMRNTSGVFTLSVGNGLNTNATSISLINAFNNNASLSGASCVYSPQPNDARKIRLSFDDGTGNGSVVLATDQSVTSVPYAFNANQLSGYGADDFLKVSAIATQAKLEQILSKTNELTVLASGTSNVYVRTSDVSNTINNIVNVAIDNSVNSMRSSGTFGGSVVINTSGAINTSGSMNAAIIYAPTINSTTINSTNLNSTNVTSTTSNTTTLNATNVVSSNVSSNVVSSQSHRFFDSSNNKYVTLSAGSLSANYNFIFPQAPGANGTLLSTDASGQLSWISPSSLSSTSLQGQPISVTAPSNGQFFKFVGGSWSPTLITINDLRNTSGASMFPASACAAGSHLGWDSSTGGFTCSTLPSATASDFGLVKVGSGLAINTGVISLGNVTINNLKSSVGGSMFPAAACAAGTVLAWNSMADSFVCSAIPVGSTIQAGLLQVGTGLAVSGGVVGLPSIMTAGNYNLVNVDQYGRVTSGTLATTLAGFGITDAVKNNGGVVSMQSGTDATRPTAGTLGRIYISIDAQKIYRDNGTTWDLVSSVPETGTTANKIVQLDNSAKLPAVDGSQLTNLPKAPLGTFQVFNANGNFVVPAGVTKVYVQVWGGGGGGAGGSTLGLVGGGGGAGGGYGAGTYTVVPNGTVAVTVGAQGTKGNPDGAGTVGGDSSFGIHITATGGAGGVTGGTAAIPGTSTSPLGVTGEAGVPPALAVGGDGGASSQGGYPGRGALLLSGSGSNGGAPGAGGGGGMGGLLSTSTGGQGGMGRVIVWY